MEGWIVGVIALALVAGVTAFFLWRKKVKKAEEIWKLPAHDRARKIKETVQPVLTPNGWKVYFEKGADPNTHSAPAMDAGIEKGFQKAGCAGYPIDRTRHDISIFVFNSELDSQGDPAYRQFVGTMSPYFNSEWDKMQGKGEEVDHYILAAAQTISVGDPFGDGIVVPHHTGKEAHLSTVCEYEMEHVLLAWHDGEKFEATKHHTDGTGHPLIGECIGASLLFSSRPFTGTCGGAVK